jgi:ribosomal-protein-alanine N-acetyltransferase
LVDSSNYNQKSTIIEVTMHPPLTITTSRLVLRPPVMEDADAIFQGYARDPEVTRYLTWQPHADISVTRAFLARCIDCWAQSTAFPWVLTLADSQRLIGMIELRISPPRADLGYGVARPFWGQGFATEAVQAVVGWGITQPEIYRVWAVCDVENKGSARVLEKAGMQREGVLKRWLVHPNIDHEPRDCYCYAKVK